MNSKLVMEHHLSKAGGSVGVHASRNSKHLIAFHVNNTHGVSFSRVSRIHPSDLLESFFNCSHLKSLKSCALHSACANQKIQNQRLKGNKRSQGRPGPLIYLDLQLERKLVLQIFHIDIGFSYRYIGTTFGIDNYIDISIYRASSTLY